MKKINMLACALLSSTFSASTLAHIAMYTGVFDRMEVHVAGTYSKPSNNGLSIGDFHLYNYNLTSFFEYAHRTAFLEPGFDWDYSLGASYLFANSQTRLFLDYEHYNNTDERVLFGAVNLFVLNGTENARVEEHWHEVRAGLDHYLQFGRQFFLDLSAYLAYDRLMIDLTEMNLNGRVSGGNPRNAFREIYNEVEGWGPGLGVKILGAPFVRCPSFKAFAGVRTTLLYAYNDFRSYEYRDTEDNLYFGLEPEGTNSIVAKFDLDMGVDYSAKVLIEGCPTLMGVTLGFRFMNMVNVLKNGNGYDYDFGYALNTGSSQDWGKVGPYIEFKIGGARS